MTNVLASPYEIYEIIMESNHAQRKQRLKLRIGSTGKRGHMRR